MIYVILVLGFLIAIGMYLVFIYNKFVTLRNRYKNAFAQIDVQLKRRYDLIPNLVSVAKEYMKHEKETFEEIAKARSQALNGLSQANSVPGNANAMQQLMLGEGMLRGALGKFNMVIENYPELKANQNMLKLSEELLSTENRVGFARQGFNDCVMEYNNFRESFPPVLFSSSFGHSERISFLEFEDADLIKKVPTVEI